MQREELMDLRRGNVFVLSSGEYSDYGYEGILVAIKDFNIRDEAEKFKATLTEETKWDQHRAFPGYLVSQHLAMPVDYREIHLGYYGELDPS